MIIKKILFLLKTFFPIVCFAQIDVSTSANFGIMKSKFNKVSVYGTAYSVSPSVEFGKKETLSLFYIYSDMNASSELIEKIKLQKISLLYGARTDAENKKFSFHFSAGPSIFFVKNREFSKSVFGIEGNLQLSHQLLNFFSVNLGINTSQSFSKEINTLIYPYFGMKLDLFKTKK